MKAIRKTTTLASLLLLAVLTLSQGCIVVDNTPPGPPGIPGRAFFGVNFENAPPYSYWDENPSIPDNPALGAYHATAPGVYYFEYFVNYHEYWYGTYEVFINPGGPGLPNGQRGVPGADTYLMLVVDPYYGPYEVRYKNDGTMADEPIVIEEMGYRIEMRKADANVRPPKKAPIPRN